MFDPNFQYSQPQQQSMVSPIMAAALQKYLSQQPQQPPQNNQQQLMQPQIGGQGGMPNQLMQPQGYNGLVNQSVQNNLQPTQVTNGG